MTTVWGRPEILFPRLDLEMVAAEVEGLRALTNGLA
jgi:hypothetical protein